jgi:alpha-N-arabinofuranosidase
VLQALILTDKEKMLLTPTYYVFDLYKAHQDAKLLPIMLNSPQYSLGDEKIPAVNASASLDSNNVIHITMVNLDPHHTINVSTIFSNVPWKTVNGQVLTSAKFTDINTFEAPHTVQPAKFNGAKKNGNNLSVSLPPQSVVLLELK